MLNNSPDKLTKRGHGPAPAAEAKFDQNSFEIFFKENYASLCAYCQMKFNFDLDLANEAVHSAFVKLWENRHAITRNVAKKTYLISIVNNNCIDIIRHNKVKQQHADHFRSITSASVAAEFGKVDEKKMITDIHEAISQLPLQMRIVFQLSRFDGLKNHEIATRLQISVKTVETQMSRALAKLKNKLAGYATYVLFGIFISQ